MKQRRGTARISGLAMGSLLLATLLASTMAIVPTVYAATPQLDCGGSACIATYGSASGGSTHPITMTGSLSTSNSPDLIVVIVTGDAPGDTPATPTLSGVTFSSVCSYTAAAPVLAVYAGKASSTLSSATITETESGATGNSVGGMVAFGISGYDSTASTAFDGTCSITGGSGTALSLSISSLAYGNDFVFGAAASAAGAISASGSTSLVAANANAVYTGAGYQLGNGGGSYTMTFSSSSSGAWTEAVAAVEGASPSAVPLFPAGVLPLLGALPAIYYLVTRKQSVKSAEEDGQ